MRYSILPVVLFGLACSKSEPATPAASPSATASEASTAPSEAPATPDQVAAPTDEGAKEEPPSIALVAAGSEPRRVLLRTFEGGAKETMKIRSQVTMIANLGVEGEQKTVIPAILHRLGLEVQSVQPDGTATVGFEVIRSEVLPDKGASASIRDKMEAAVASLRGLRGTYRVDAQGIITGVEIAEPTKDETRDSHMAQSIGEFIYRSTVPVPNEAVGRGGKWTVSRRLKEGGIFFDQTSTYELKKSDRSNMVVAVKTERSAPNQQVGPQNAYELELFTATGSGRVDVDPGRLVPRLATSKSETQIKMTMQGPGGTTMQTDLTVDAEERISRP